MKELNVRKISAANIPVEALPALLDEEKIDFQPIGNANWKEQYPYQPEAYFRLAHTNDSVLLHYRVKEATVRAEALNDNGPVWQDSCMEFFVCPGGDNIYYNLECNCAGTLLIGAGTGRAGREHAPVQVMEQVQRWSSLGRQPFAERPSDGAWEVALIVPFTAFFKHDIQSLDECELPANFYKCGDKLEKPHFLSWNAITLPKPDFHCPAFFGRLHFE